MPKSDKTYSHKVRQQAVRLVIEEGQSARSVGAQLNIHHTSVAAWVRKYRRGGLVLDSDAPIIDKDAYIRRLEKELARTQMERDFLKKAEAFEKSLRK